VATAVPHGIIVSMAAEVPMPLRRFNEVAVTRAMPPGASAAEPSPRSPLSGSPSSAASLAAHPVHAMHSPSATAAVIRIIVAHDIIAGGVGRMRYIISLALLLSACTRANPDAIGGGGGAAGSGGGGAAGSGGVGGGGGGGAAG